MLFSDQDVCSSAYDERTILHSIVGLLFARCIGRPYGIALPACCMHVVDMDMGMGVARL